MKKSNLFLRKYVSPGINIYKVATSSLLSDSVTSATSSSGDDDGTESLGTETEFSWE